MIERIDIILMWSEGHTTIFEVSQNGLGSCTITSIALNNQALKVVLNLDVGLRLLVPR